MIDDLTDLDTVPAIAMTQWRAGRVLDDKDVAMIAALLDEQDRIEADATEAFHRGRKEALFEIGGKELVDAVERGDAANSEICLKKAYASLAAKEAELKAMMKSAGFGHVDVHNLSAGVVALHVGIKC